MATRMEGLVLQSVDKAALADWWCRALGWRVAYADDDEVDVGPQPGQPGIELCVVDDGQGGKRGRNRLHLDLTSTSAADQRATVERLLAAGAAPTDVGQQDVPWVVLADPEGDELCVLEPRDELRGLGPVGIVVHPALDPDALAAFWQAASGWHPVPGREFPTLQSPDGGPLLEFVPTDEPPHGPRPRLHLDVRPLPGHPQAGEVARLRTLGAEPVDIGQGDVPWVVLTDPEGNAFCVLRTPDA